MGIGIFGQHMVDIAILSILSYSVDIDAAYSIKHRLKNWKLYYHWQIFWIFFGENELAPHDIKACLREKLLFLSLLWNWSFGRNVQMPFSLSSIKQQPSKGYYLQKVSQPNMWHTPRGAKCDPKRNI